MHKNLQRCKNLSLEEKKSCSVLFEKYNIEQKIYLHIFLLIISFPPPFQSKFSMESLTKPELLMLFSILEGELEARDLVIDALKVLKVSSLTIIFMLLCVAVHLFYCLPPSRDQRQSRFQMENSALSPDCATEFQSGSFWPIVAFATTLHTSFFSLHESLQRRSLLSSVAILVAQNKNGWQQRSRIWCSGGLGGFPCDHWDFLSFFSLVWQYTGTHKSHVDQDRRSLRSL